jgi:hypothetical protein
LLYVDITQLTLSKDFLVHLFNNCFVKQLLLILLQIEWVEYVVPIV